MRYKRAWRFGGDKRAEADGYICPEDDFVIAYIAENGKRIDCGHGFCSASRWYEVDGETFYILKMAKEFVERVV